MKKLLLLSISILTTTALFSQQANWKSERYTFARDTVINMSEITEDWEVHLQNLEMPKPGSQSTRAQLYRLKEKAREKYPRKANTKVAFSPDIEYDTLNPILDVNFEGNIAGGSVPNDNDMAISNDGLIVSAINSIVYMFDANNPDTLLLKRSLATFTTGLSFGISKFDPKVAYDPIADRFILVFLAGSTYQTSKIIIAYSQTNDPTGDWNSYTLKGNPLNNDTWSDYPVIAINNQELFIGFNTFTNGSSNNSGFVEGTFWQIDNLAGYAGDSLLTKYYHHILCECAGKDSAIFNVSPMKGGSIPYGPNMYLLATRNLSIESDTIFLMEVTGRVTDPSTTLKVKTLKSDNKYFLPPAAHQFGVHEFDTNDSRVLGGFYENGKIQFVTSTMDTSTGLAGVYHGFIEDPSSNAPHIYGNVISHPILDLGYPNISYSGRAPQDQEAIINVNHTADTVFSGFSAFYYTNKGTYSELMRIKAGETYVDRLSSDLERWGDYSGSQKKYNEEGTVWAVGSWGKQGKKHGTWIAEIHSPDSIRPVTYPPTTIAAYPNPTTDLVFVNFDAEVDGDIEIAVFDVNGRLVKKLYTDRVKEGQNVFQFSTQPLPAGIYFVRGISGDKELFKSKVVKHGRDY